MLAVTTARYFGCICGNAAPDCSHPVLEEGGIPPTFDRQDGQWLSLGCPAVAGGAGM
jgi:hypothetical protein